MTTQSKWTKKIAVIGAVALASFAINLAPSIAHAAPACAVGPVTQCQGVTSDGAPYVMQVPGNFNGTAFIFSHGYRYNVELPSLGYPKVLNTPVPAPGDSAAEITAVATYLLSKGYAVFGSGFARQGWNADSGLATDVELISTFKTQFPKTTHVVAWGESLGGFMTQALAEKHPELISAAAPMCLATNTVEAELTMAGDFLWGLKTFFDPSIQGGNYKTATESLQDLGRVVTLLGALKTSISTGEWPATTPAPVKAMLGTIPPRSALLLVGLIAGVPTQSAHFDGSTGPGSPNTSAYTSFALAGSPALAILENGANAAVLAVLATADVELQSGGAIFDNSKTDYTARVESEKAIFTSGLSGASATAGMLAYLKAAPRATAPAASVAKMRALLAYTGKINVPTITMAGVADPITPAGGSQWMANQYAKQYAAAKAAALQAKNKRPASALVSIWGVTPNHYTTFDATGVPITSAPAANGTTHCNFTVKQYTGVADLLAQAASTGALPNPQTIATKVRKMGGSIVDAKFEPALPKFYTDNM